MQQEFNSSIKVRERFIDGEESLSALIIASIFLARLDIVFRVKSANIADEYFRNNNEQTYFSQNVTIDDKQVAANIYEMALVFKEIIKQEYWLSAILNPSFGVFSVSVGGADADFIVDDVLVDIKTKDKFTYSAADFAQLFGYAAMARASGKDVNKVAVYFARFGIFTAIDLDDRIVGGDKFLSKFLDIIMSSPKGS